MPARATKIAPVLFPMLLASAAFAAESSQADNCLTAPKGAASTGSHWYYRIDRANKRQCWYLGDARLKSPRQKSTDTASAESAPTEQLRIAPTVADARAELVSFNAETATNSSAATETQQVVSGLPEALPATGSPVILRWPEATSPNMPLQFALASSATKKIAGDTRTIPPVAADAGSDTHAISIPLLFAAIAGAMGTAGLFGAVIHRLGRARRTLWDQPPAGAVTGTPSNVADQRITQMMARLSRSAAIS